MNTLKKIIEKKGIQKLWGEEYKGNDVLCDFVLGDGKKLMVLTMLATRPFSHYIRVDSKINLEEDDWEQEVFEALTECFGDYESMIDDEDLEYNEHNLPDFPIVDSSCGYTYGIVRWRDILEKTSHKTEYDYKKKYNVCKAYLRYKKKKHLLNKEDENYIKKFWEIIGDLDNVSIRDVLDYEREIQLAGGQI